MAKEAANTGLGPTTIVAVEQYYPPGQRIINDEFAFEMHPFALRAFIGLAKYGAIRNRLINVMEKNFPGLYAGTLSRKKYIDDKIINAVDEINTMVNLGAGFDTRALRLPQLLPFAVWEVDQPENIRSKQKRLNKLFNKTPSNIHLVSIDFDYEDLNTVLCAQGFSNKMKTFFVWEAVTQYLTEEGIKSTFNFLANAASGSKLAFTYVRKDFIDGKELFGWERIYKRFIENNQIWRFGMEVGTWTDFLKKYGWVQREDIGYRELLEIYIAPKGRQLKATPVERIVYAEKI